MRDTYINSNLNLLTKFTSSSRCTEFIDILPCNISQLIMKTIPISTRIIISYMMKQGILFSVYWKVNWNWDNMIRISQWRESHCRTNTSVRRKKKIQKSKTVRVTVRDPNRKVNHLSTIIWDKKNYNILHQVYQFHQNRLAISMMDIKVSKDKHISRLVDQETLIYVRWNRIRNWA